MEQAERTAESTDYHAPDWIRPPTVIVGAGPVGQRLVRELRLHDATREIVIFGDEPWAPYDRVKLSSWLAGESVVLPAHTLSDDVNLHMQLGTRIAKIDRANRRLVDDAGKTWAYDKLVLATGSRAYIPPIPGTSLNGVYTFRNLADAQLLMARTVRSRSMVVIGGGLLGLETARALRRFNTQVTIIEQSARLMFHQLDQDSATVLRKHVESLGIRVIPGERVVSIDGYNAVHEVKLAGGGQIECDTVVIAAGITPNIELARDCGLDTRRGILVDDTLSTRDPHIHAIGECAEHRNTVYGLVSPGYEQAAVVAHVLSGKSADYQGSLAAASLKVIDTPVSSVGEVETEWSRRELTWRDKKSGMIRKVMLDGNRLDAAMGVGEWDEFSRIREGVRTRRRIRPWRALRFILIGTLWSAEDEGAIADWPASAVVCNCKAVSRGELTRVVDHGCSDVDCLASETGASTVCGSCKPLLAKLLGAVSIEPVRAFRVLTAAAFIAALATLVWYSPVVIPYTDTVQTSLRVDELWRNGLIKQISGFTLLGLSVLLGLVSLRKRVAWLSWGSFDGWRTVHVLTGVLTIAALVAHTGFRFGDNLNFWLMLVFTGLMLAGAAAAAVTGLQHILPLSLARRTRAFSIWSHVLLLWPLPALLGFHILKSYWY